MLTDLSFFNNKKVFITGHTGFKGSWLIEILKKAGSVIGGYSLTPDKNSLYSLINTDGIVSTIGDIRNPQLLYDAFGLFNPDIVIHMAAQPLVLESYDNPAYTFEVNIMGTVNILECLRKKRFSGSFLNVTTDKVYENKEWEWAYRENEKLCGKDPYSNSKSCSEIITSSYKDSFFKNAICTISTARSGNVIGGGDFAKDRIIPDCIKSALLKEQIQVRNPWSVRPYQHVLDSLFGYLTLIERQSEVPSLAGSYNFGPDESGCVSTGMLAELFCKHWGENLSWRHIDSVKKHEATVLRLDPTLARIKLGHTNRWNIEKAVQKTVEWAKAYRDKKNLEMLMKKQIEEYLADV